MYFLFNIKNIEYLFDQYKNIHKNMFVRLTN